MTPLVLEEYLSVYPYDADTQSAVELQMERWETAGVDFVKVHPNVRNFGAEINPEREKADIRQNIAILLEFPLAMVSNTRLVRC